MNIAIVTNIRSPYKVLQIEEIAKCKDYLITVYYTDNDNFKGRNWESKNKVNFDEEILKGKKISSTYGYLNTGLFDLVKKNDIIIICGYSQPTYIVLSMLCKLMHKPYALIFDGITIGHEIEKNSLKDVIKKLVINNASGYFANGRSGEIFFNQYYKQPMDKIFNQYLTVDTKHIYKLKSDAKNIRNNLRKRYGILENKKVLIYSGRVIGIKNLFRVVDALELIQEEIIFFVIGGGELEEELKIYASKKGVKIIITGFLSNQEDVFSHYFIGDAFILPSTEEAWGLVVNEAMAAGLNVIVSNRAGCSLDLVKDNGELINPYDVYSIKNSISDVLLKGNYCPKSSEKIIEDWCYENSAQSFKNLIKSIEKNR